MSAQRKRKIFSQRARLRILDFHGEYCYLCTKIIDITGLWHIDHVYPWSLGGTDEIENTRPTHVRCNELKGDSLQYARQLAKCLVEQRPVKRQTKIARKKKPQNHPKPVLAIGHGWTRDDWVKSIRGVPREKIFYREGANKAP